MSFIIRNLYLVNVICRKSIVHFHRSRYFHNLNIMQSLLRVNLALTSPRRAMSTSNIKNIGYAELKKEQDKGTLIIDVREPDEIAETGILPGGINIPVGEVSNAFSKTPDNFKKSYGRQKPDKDTEMVFSCRSGKRSLKASQTVTGLGFTNVMNYEGGWLDWEKHSNI